MIKTHRSMPVAYRLSFTAVSLRPDLARIAAEAYLTCGNWAEARRKILSNNSFQCRTKSALHRMEREIRLRLERLTKDQLILLAKGTSEERAAMTWLATLKYAALAREFAADILRGKLAGFDPILRPSDYTNFIAARISSHPELAKLTESSRRKIQRVLLLMLTEAGLLQEENKERRITRPMQTQHIVDSVIFDNPQFLAGFLWTDEEIAAIGKRP